MTHQFQMSFDLGNDEFADAEARRLGIARLLTDTAAKVLDGNVEGTLFDVNGNSVGHWGFDEVDQ